MSEFYGYDDEDEKDNIVDFSYRDIGPESRIGGYVDDDIEQSLGTGAVQIDIQYRTDIDPQEQFTMDVQRILREETHLRLQRDEQSIIKRAIRKIPFIKYKNPLMYVLGYYVSIELQSGGSMLKKKLKLVEPYIRTHNEITMFEILKYARYWNLVLNKK